MNYHSKKRLMKIGISLVTYNRKLFSEQCIKSILWSNPEDVSMVIIDNHSSDGTQDMLSKVQEENDDIIKPIVYNSENKQAGYAINQGWEILSEHCDVVGSVANDMFVEPGWDRNIRACMEELNIDYIISLVRPRKEKLKKITLSGEGHYVKTVELAACTFLRSEHFLKGFRWSIVSWGKGRIGAMPEFNQMLRRGTGKHGPLVGATLAAPGFIARHCEYTNPDYIEYYDKTFGERVMLTELARRRKLESEGNASSISLEYKHSLNWDGFLSKYYPEKIEVAS